MIDATARRNFQTGDLTKEKKKERFLLLKLTDTSSGQLQSLLLCNPRELASPATQALEAIQFCLLDTASPPNYRIRTYANARSAKETLSKLRLYCLNCPHNGI